MGESPKKRVGLFGGSFDPVHYGHLANAEAARTQANLDEVIFIPAGQNPFKESQSRSHREDCLNMLREAISTNSKFLLSRVEVDKPGKSYTVETVEKIREQRPDQDYFFIIGTDLLYDIERWKDAENLLSTIGLIVLTRPDPLMRDQEAKIQDIRDRYGTEVIPVEMPKLAISSTKLREMIREGRSIRYYTPDPVIDYIEEHHLYRGEPDETKDV